jgi:heptosyltransferase-2
MRLHEVDRNLSLLRGLGEEPQVSDRHLHVGYTEREVAEVRAVLAAEGIPRNAMIVGLCPGSIWGTKRWPAEHYAAVGREFVHRGRHVVILGGPDDRAVAEEVAQGIGPGAHNVAGKTSLKALAAWMDKLELLITNDSSPLHVAAARGTATVAIFGATVPAMGFGPFHSQSLVVENEMACRPCSLHGPKACPKGHFRCMTQLLPASVIAAADELLVPGG